MKKNKLFLFLLPCLLVAGCNDSKSSSTNSSSSKEIVDFEVPITLAKLKNLFTKGGVSYNLEEQETKSSTRHTKEVTTKMWSIETTITNETLTTYEGPFAYLSGTEKVTHEMTDEFVSQYPDENDTYQTFRGVYNDKYYEVIDYGVGKDRDYAVVLNITDNVTDTASQIKMEDVIHYSNTTASDFVWSYLNYMNSINGLLDPDIKADKSFSYHLESEGESADDYGVYPFNVSLDLDFEKDGFLKRYNLVYEMRYIDDETQIEIDYGSIEDEIVITRGEKTKVNNNYPLVPTDYWLTDYEVQLSVTNRDLETYNVNPNEIPIDCYVDANAVSVIPEKALDTDVKIVSSTNNGVVSVNEYGVVRSVGAGTATLTVSSSTGIEKTIDVTVFIPDALSVELKCYSLHHYKGETYNLYVYWNPDNVREELDWHVDHPEILEVDFDDAGDPIVHCLEAGTATITITAKGKPTVTDSLTFTVTEKLSAEQINQAVIGKWINQSHPEQYVQFNADLTGSFFYDYEFTFTWSITITANNVTIHLSTVTPNTTELTYSYDGNNIADVALDGLSLRLELGFSSYDYWAFEYAGTFIKEN